MKHQKFLNIVFILFCFFLIQEKAFAEEKLSISHGPYLIDPGYNSITIVWLTNKNCVSWVEYCGDTNFGTFPIWGGYPKFAKSSQHGLIDANTKLHSIQLSDLEPGTKYKYRVVSKEILQFNPYEVLFGDSIVSDVFQLETLDSNKTNFSFAVTTDVHEQADVLDTLLQNIPTESLDMVFLTGDILSWLDNEEQIFNGFLDVCINHFAKEKPLIYLKRNHETRGHFARNFPIYFPHQTSKFYYSFNQGNVHFIILDSGEDKPDSHPVYAGLVDFDNYRTEQAEWLITDIQSKRFQNAKYRIVMSHLPLFLSSSRHGVTDVTKKWGPILNDANIDLLFSGHTHRYSHINPTDRENNFPIVIIGKHQIVKSDVSDKQLLLTIKNKIGEIVDTISILSKKK